MLILAEVCGKSAHCTWDRQQALTLIEPFLKPKRGLSTTYQSREVSVGAVTEKACAPRAATRSNKVGMRRILSMEPRGVWPMRFISLPTRRKPSLTACLRRQGYYRYAPVPLPARPLKFVNVGLGLIFHPIQRQTCSDAKPPWAL